MPNQTCSTVKIVAKNEQGFVIYNESDVTPEMKVFGAVPTASVKTPVVTKPVKAVVNPDPAIPQPTMPWQNT